MIQGVDRLVAATVEGVCNIIGLVVRESIINKSIATTKRQSGGRPRLSLPARGFVDSAKLS